MDEDEESSESEIESFECVACNKQFKSQNQFEAHERSKKHAKAVKQLCRDMRMQNDELDLEPTVSGTVSPHPVSASINVPVGSASVEDNDDHVAAPLTAQRKESISDSLEDASEAQPSDNPSPVDGDVEPPSRDSQSRSDSLDEDYASRESVENRLRPDFDSSLSNDPITPLTEQLSSADLGDEPSAPPQVGKAKQKRAKKAARNAEQPTGITCTNCNASFTSKTKLFTHLKENPGHAQLLKTTGKSKKR